MTYCFLLLILVGFCNGQGRDNIGTEFIIGWMDNMVHKQSSQSYDLELFVTTSSNTPATVTITAPLHSPGKTLAYTTVSRGNIEKITLSNTLRGSGIEINNKGVLIEATQDITLYGVNKEMLSTDGFVAFPTDALGSEYILITWSSDGQFTVVGVSDATAVNITLPTGVTTSLNVTYKGNTYKNGDSFIVLLDRFQVFHCYQRYGDLTGTKVVASNPVAVFSGARKVAVKDRITVDSLDHLVEQMMPVETWGKDFFTISTPDRTIGDYFRIVASEDATTITIGGNAPITLNAQEFEQIEVSTGDYKTISADKAVMVAMFGKSYSGATGDSLRGGDPHMTLMLPVPQFLSDYTFSTVQTTSGEFTNYLFIVINSSKTSGLVLDNNPATKSWTTISGSSLVAATFGISPGSHSVYHTDPAATFMAIAFGNAHANSYAYACGIRLAQINTVCNPTATVAGDIIDNDCDGLIDEETNNGIDDDGDGRIDEDLAIPPRINGNWADWGQWGVCSLTCNSSSSGIQTRTRNCSNPAPANNGLDCSGNDRDTQDCTTSTNCPIDGQWGSWSAWSVCLVTCGNGNINRTRDCYNPDPQYGVANCVGNNTEFDTCWKGTCYPSIVGNIDNNCSWTWFGCKSGVTKCIDLSFRCDGTNDCDDGSDESAEIAGCGLCSFGHNRSEYLTASIALLWSTLLLLLVMTI